MEKILRQVAALALIMWLTGCTAEQKEIIIYGSMSCDHCVEFKSEMDAAGISYTFKEVEGNDEIVLEMLEQTKKIGFKGQIFYPVVAIGEDVVLVRPSIELVKEKL